MNRKIEDLTDELLSIRLYIKRLKLELNPKVVQEIDLKIKRLLLNFDVKEDAIIGDNIKSKLINVCPEQYKGTLSGYPLYKSGFVTSQGNY